MLAVAEVDAANDVRTAVQRNLVTDIRERVERQPSGRDELLVLVRAVHARDGAADGAAARDHRGRPGWRRIPASTIAGGKAPEVLVCVSSTGFLPVRRGQNPLALLGSLHTVVHSTAFEVARNLTLFFVALLWLGLAFWVHRDARRRIGDPWLGGTATFLGLVPLAGPLAYLLFRPPETLADVKARRAELRALERHLLRPQPQCPVCRAGIEPSFLVCPVCTTQLKTRCGQCAAPLEPLWQACPHCATPVGATPVGASRLELAAPDLETALTARALAPETGMDDETGSETGRARRVRAS